MTKKSGLGVGLEALFGLNSNIERGDETVAAEVVEIKLGDIMANPNQPRKNFDEQPLNELAQSIKTCGVLQPILLVKRGSLYEIVAGERRFRASKLAGLETIPAIVKELTPQQIKEISLIENLQRQDLNPIEEAKAYRALIEEYGFTQEELAEKLGKSRPAITNALRLLALNPTVVELVTQGRLSAGHARCLAAIKDFSVQASYAVAACDKQMSVRQLEIMVANYLNPDKTPKKIKPVLSTEIKGLIHDMQYVFGTKVKAVGNGNKGRIYIDYYTEGDLSRIFDLIEKLKRQ